MQHDRKITISAGNNRRAMSWQPLTMMLSELWARLQTPARGTETLAEYLNMKKAQQDDLKDVGGFMAGTLNRPRRKANNVTGRDLITLDLDNIPAGGTENVLRRVEGLGCGYSVYSTAYWVKDNVFYALRVFGNETDKAEIQATLDKLLAEI